MAALADLFCDLLVVWRAWDLRNMPREPGNFLSPATRIQRESRPGEASGRLAAAVLEIRGKKPVASSIE